MASPSPWDIDTYLNPFIPRSFLYLLPRPISHFFGYRSPNSTKFQAHILIVWAWCFLGAFLGVALIEGVYLHLPTLDNQHVPIVIASFGAAAILEYNIIESPLAQPRNLVLGHFFSALIGTSITKLFHLLPDHRFEQLRWLAGALSVGAASVVMSMTKTVHPPAGATALLAATDSAFTDLGWWLLPLVLLGSMLMLTSALIINNIMRQFPMYWWTPVDLAALHKKKKAARDLEKEGDLTAKDLQAKEGDEQAVKVVSGSDTPTDTDSEAVDDKDSVPGLVEARRERLRRRSIGALQSEIIIARDEIVVPHWFHANDWELNVLQILQQRLISVSHVDRASGSSAGRRSGSRSKSRGRRNSSARGDAVMKEIRSGLEGRK
jgi:CBS-domain-containing membrane protein